eukprot:Pgem_evm1s5785
MKPLNNNGSEEGKRNEKKKSNKMGKFKSATLKKIKSEQIYFGSDIYSDHDTEDGNNTNNNLNLYLYPSSNCHSNPTRKKYNRNSIATEPQTYWCESRMGPSNSTTSASSYSCPDFSITMDHVNSNNNNNNNNNTSNNSDGNNDNRNSNNNHNKSRSRNPLKRMGSISANNNNNNINNNNNNNKFNNSTTETVGNIKYDVKGRSRASSVGKLNNLQKSIPMPEPRAKVRKRCYSNGGEPRSKSTRSCLSREVTIEAIGNDGDYNNLRSAMDDLKLSEDELMKCVVVDNNEHGNNINYNDNDNNDT